MGTLKYNTGSAMIGWQQLVNGQRTLDFDVAKVKLQAIQGEDLLCEILIGTFVVPATYHINIKSSWWESYTSLEEMVAMIASDTDYQGNNAKDDIEKHENVQNGVEIHRLDLWPHINE